MIPSAEEEADNALLGKDVPADGGKRANGDAEGARALGQQSLGLLNDMSKIKSLYRQTLSH